MRNVDIRVFQIARTQEDVEQMREWLDHVGATNYPVPIGLSGAEQVTGHAAKRCYMSFEPGLNKNVTKVRRDWDQYFANILNSGHGSVLEHGTYSYAIEGCSRVFTAEMNRHRAGVAISEGSLRYIRFDDIPWWMPTSLQLTAEEVAHQADMETVNPELSDSIYQKTRSQEDFNKAFEHAQECYKELCDIWGIDNPDKKMPFSKKKVLTSMFRRIIPMGVATGGVWTMNIRALRHIIALRTTPHAEEEIALVMSLIAKDIVEREPRLMCDFVQDKETGCWVPEYFKV